MLRTLVLGLCALSTAQAQVATIHAETHLVNLTFTARDAEDRLVRGLGREDFTVYEDGVQQKISVFSKESELPLTLGLLVDASSSQDKFLKQHLRDINTFLNSILQPRDQVFAMCFGNHLRLVSEPSSDTAQILSNLEKFDKGERDFPELEVDDTREGGSAIFDAVVASVEHEGAKRPDQRKALILFTDGEENASSHDELEAIAAAQDADTLVYAVRYTQINHHKLTAANRQGIAVLRHMTEQTGGRDFDALHVDLPQAFKQIADELRSLYSIGYYSTNKRLDNTFRKIVVEPHPEGVTVRAKSGYYAAHRSER